MKVITYIKNNKLLTAVAIAYLTLLFAMPEKAVLSTKNSMYYVIEMLQIMPVVFILTSIIEAWVPKEVIMKGFGDKSGVKGSIFSFLLGSLSAGPIYAAFPICKMLLKKGASVANIVIILSAWAVVKVPMLANEAKFLGLEFMGVRWILTTISIFIMAFLVSKLVKKESIPIDQDINPQEKGVIHIHNEYCIGCGICAKIAPESFVMENKKAGVKEEPYQVEDIANIKSAVEKCPSKAITF